MIKVQNILKEYNNKVVLENVSFNVEEGDKVAIVGTNGVGKSTLLKIIAGVEESEKGTVEFDSEDVCIGYLIQDTRDINDLSIRDFIRTETGINQLEKELTHLENHLDNDANIEKYGEIQSMFLKLEGYSFEYNMSKTLTGLGLKDIDLNRKLSTVSGGQKSKIQLASILLKGVDILLLDEPTNNLDLEALLWLEKYLKSTSATCLIVSHDKLFLDRIVSKVFEINWMDRDIIEHEAGYTEYLDFKAAEKERLIEEHGIQQEEIKVLTDSINKKRKQSLYVATSKIRDNDKSARNAKNENSSVQSSKHAKQLERRIEQMDIIEIPTERSPLLINIDPDFENTKDANIQLDSVCMSYPSFELGPVSLSIPFGSKIGIFGKNGSGKSTLLKIMTKSIIPTTGGIDISDSLIIGNLQQEHEGLPMTKNLYEYITEFTPQKEESDRYFLLSQFGFSLEEGLQSISTLSPGGRVRLILASFSALSVNTLILDEPTNHMDVEAIAALEEVLKDFKGTIILISHDRSFIKSVNPTANYMMKKGKLKKIKNYEKYVKLLSR